jgi:hypothetical protein
MGVARAGGTQNIFRIHFISCKDFSHQSTVRTFIVDAMSFLFRAFGAVQDTVTRTMYGVESQTAKTSFYSCVDKNMSGAEVPVSVP